MASLKLEDEGFAGEVLGPDSAGYDEARSIWNAAIDRRPALIARCSGSADVIAALRFAREKELLVAIRGGGHNVAGTALCDGGLVIDLSRMKGIRVDPVARRAWAQPGLLWGEFDHETQAFGMAAPGGIVSHTGMPGLTLGGGIGWLMRRDGLTCDNLVAADVIGADCGLLQAGEDGDEDLLWALRGGGGNFGVVTSFEFKLAALDPAVAGGMVLFAAEEAEQVIGRWRDYIEGVPREVATILALRFAPATPAVPEELQGGPVVGILAFYAGPAGEGERALAPIKGFGVPLLDTLGVVPYVSHQKMLDLSVPHGLRYYWKSEYLAPLGPGAIQALAANAWKGSSKRSYTLVFHLGGAVADLGDADTAFSGRGATHAVNINAVWSDPAEDAVHPAWAREFWSAISPFSAGGVYMNFLGNEGEDRIRAAYGASKYERLADLKARYDPDNVFRVNQNIRPSPKG